MSILSSFENFHVLIIHSFILENFLHHILDRIRSSYCPNTSHVTLITDGHDLSRNSLVQFNHSVVSNSLRPNGLKHARPPCPSPTPGAYSNSCPLSRWCHPTVSSSVIPFSSCLQSFPAIGSFPMSQFFTLGGQSIGVSASTSVLPMNIQDWFLLGWTGWISLLSKGLLSHLQHQNSKVSILGCSAFFMVQLSYP